MTRTNSIAFDKKHDDNRLMLNYILQSMIELPPCNIHR